MNAQAPLTERQIQRRVLKRLHRLLPPEAFFFHVPNQLLAPERTRNPADYGGALLGDGARPGMADLVLLHRGAAYALEVKRPGERLSPVQCAVHDRLAAAGVPVATVFSADGAESALRGWGLPLGGA